MNILSHYFLDAKAGKPYYNAGLVMPDLMGSFRRGWKPARSAPDISLKPEFKEFSEGMQQHQMVDRQFHSSAFFTNEIPFIRKVLEQNGLKLPGVRLFFVAHIMLELMLDRLILLDSNKSADLFYHDIEAIDINEVNAFFDPGLNEGGHSFSDFFTRFREAKYIYNYVKDDDFIYALNRIMKRASQPVFEGDSVVDQLKKSIFEVETHLAPVYLEHFEELKQKLIS